MEMERRFDAEEAEIQRILLTHDQENGRALGTRLLSCQQRRLVL